MTTARVTEIDGHRHLVLTDCPSCHKSHETVLQIAEVKFSMGGEFYPYFSPCPNSRTDIILLRFEAKTAGVGLALIHRDLFK